MYKSLITSLLCFAFCSLGTAATIATPDLVFDISDEWQVLVGTSSQSFTLRSAPPLIEANVLTENSPKITGDNLIRATDSLLKAALVEHERTAKDRGLTLKGLESRIGRNKDWQTGELIGQDNTGRNFRLLILVRPSLILTIYVDSKSVSQDDLLSVVFEIVSGIK